MVLVPLYGGPGGGGGSGGEGAGGKKGVLSSSKSGKCMKACCLVRFQGKTSVTNQTEAWDLC